MFKRCFSHILFYSHWLQIILSYTLFCLHEVHLALEFPAKSHKLDLDCLLAQSVAKMRLELISGPVEIFLLLLDGMLTHDPTSEASL